MANGAPPVIRVQGLCHLEAQELHVESFGNIFRVEVELSQSLPCVFQVAEVESVMHLLRVVLELQGCARSPAPGGWGVAGAGGTSAFYRLSAPPAPTGWGASGAGGASAFYVLAARPSPSAAPVGSSGAKASAVT